MKKYRIHRILMTVLMFAVILDILVLMATSDIRCIYILGGIALIMVLSTALLGMNHNSLFGERKC